MHLRNVGEKIHIPARAGGEHPLGKLFLELVYILYGINSGNFHRFLRA